MQPSITRGIERRLCAQKHGLTAEHLRYTSPMSQVSDKLRPLMIGIALAAALGSQGCGIAPEGIVKERIVLISLDTLRLDSFTGTAERESSMPITRAFFEGGQRFNQFYSSCATTQPSHASLFTGLHPWRHRVVRNGTVLNQEHETLAELLQESGFETTAVVASFPLHSRFGYAQGFESFDDDFAIALEAGKRNWMGNKLEGKFYSLADDVTTRALKALDALQSEQQFLWVHYYDPHTPYGDSTDAPVDLSSLRTALRKAPQYKEAAIERVRRLYEKDILHLDSALGRLFLRLQADADEYVTHIIVVSDHGESFGESNSLGHGSRLTQEQIHVPLAIISPLGFSAKGRSRRDVSGMVDLYSTILKLAHLTAPVQAQGRDLLATERGFAYGMRRVPVGGSAPEKRADGSTVMIEGSRFFIVEKDTILSGNAELVLENDDQEAQLDATHLRKIQLLFRTFQAELDDNEIETLEDAETVDALRALGYVE